MTSSIILLGSTGSIGVQTLEVAKAHNIKVTALSAHSNKQLLEEQACEFNVPETRVCLSSEKGLNALCELASIPDNVVVNAVVGSAGLRPTLAALNARNAVALANKETLVAGGELIMKRARELSVPIIPIDSEHSAIMQCLSGHNNTVNKIILTASGGPFFGYSKIKLQEVTKTQALNHPNWRMGAKISADSATMMNKGLELIEAVHLFGLSEEKIEVVVHPQSIIHSAVEFIDNSIIAQMSLPDMKLPIQYALTYPERLPCPVKSLSLGDISELSFKTVKRGDYPLIDLAREAISYGGNAPCALNAANETAVKLFLEEKIRFCEIAFIIEEAFGKIEKTREISLEIIDETDKITTEILEKICRL